MGEYSLSQVLTLGVALTGGVALALFLIRLGYRRSVLQLMRANSSREPIAVEALPSGSPLATQELPGNASPDVERLLAIAARSRVRRTLAIVLSILFVGLLQALVYLTLIEPGRMPLLAIIGATLIYSAFSFVVWLFARTLSQGQPSEVGLWAGLAAGLVSGAAVLIALQSPEIRLVTLAGMVALALLVSYVVLLASAALLRVAQIVGRLSAETIAPTLSCIGASTIGLVTALHDGKNAGTMYLGAALLFPAALAVILRTIGRPDRPSLGRDAPRLLLLRTFGHARRSSRLLRQLSRSWLELGPVDLIAGPDVASSVVTLDKVYAWLTRQLRSRFVAGPADVDRISALADRRFRDGRYPVVEFSCLDSAWRETVSTLAGNADAILMDLRSFTRQNGGCIFEIRTLMATARPERVVFLVDSTTDQRALAALLGSRFAAAVFRLESDDPSSIGRVIWATLGTLRERSGQRLPTGAPMHSPTLG